MSSSFKVNLLKSVGLLQLDLFSPARKPWEMSGYIKFLVTVMLTADGKDRTDKDEPVVIKWQRCSSGAVQFSCIASRQLFRAGLPRGEKILHHVVWYNKLNYLSGFHLIIQPFIYFITSRT